jgi:release factor glutamine methyltransferase
MANDTQLWTVLRMLDWATAYFAERHVPSPRLSIEWLLADVLKTKRLNVYMMFERPLTQAELSTLRDFVRRRARHEPLQYITGSTAFYNAEIFVSPDVLIPRPETEELVQLMLDDHPDTSGALRVLDIGTGSGCIAVALAMERVNWQITALDKSEAALKIAAKNASANNCQILTCAGDLLTEGGLPREQWDIIVSNPPYIPHAERDTLAVQVREFEPAMALFCDNRQTVYARIANYAKTALRPGGHLYLELHEDHPIENDSVFDSDWHAEILSDLSGKRRFVRARLNLNIA